MQSDLKLKIDFGKEKSGSDWRIINDDVMGGMSQSEAVIKEDSMLFSGFISLKNNGGFASVRTPEGKTDLSKFTKVKIRFKSAGRDFALVYSPDLRYFNPKYKQVFHSNSADWETQEFNLLESKETVMGKFTGNTISKEILKNIVRFGIILIDKKEGSFEIEIDYIEFS